MESEEAKTEPDQTQEEINGSATDIAATEVESQHIITSSEPLPSTVDAEDVGASETMQTVETSDNVATVELNETEAAPVESGETVSAEAEAGENAPGEVAQVEDVPAPVEGGEVQSGETAPGPVASAETVAPNQDGKTEHAIVESREAVTAEPPAEATEAENVEAVAAKEGKPPVEATEIAATTETTAGEGGVAEKRDSTPTAVEVTLPAADITEQSETIETTQPEVSATQETEIKPVEQTTEDTTTVRSEIPETATLEGSQETVKETKEEGATVTDDKDATATVKFQLLPMRQVVTIASPISQPVQLLKGQLAIEMKMDASVLQLSYQDSPLNNDTTLKDLNVQPNGTIQLDVTSTNPTESPLRTSQNRTELGMSDVITVRLIKENNDYEDVVVEIDRSFRRKPFLGGFRHKLTGAEYHHASSQTMPKPIPQPNVDRNNRDTQTVFESNRTTQTTNTTSTQMTKVGCYVSTAHDKIMYAGTYFTSEQYFERRLKAIIVLQSYFRRWQARNVVDELRQDRDKRLRWEQEEELRKRREKELRIKKEFERRMNPKTKEDFDLVYAALEKWRLEELEQINLELDGPERKAALCALLEQEAQLIASIGRHKLEASKENKEKNIERFLSKAAAPKRWKAYDGRYTEMDTQYTIRAREMKQIYNSINMKYLTQDERLDILLTLKHTVKEHDCKLTRDIIELIDREADLLMRGVSDANLEGLRKRISTLFLQYCKNPLFNPEAARLLKVPQDPSTLRKDIYYCTSANEYLPSTEFKIESNSRTIGKSRKVHDHDNIARTRQDYSHYKVMLRDLRRVEEGHADDSKIVYLIQEKDLQYLVENIWCAQSILSAWDDLYDLVLVRWDRLEEWSPWNCILLTKDEAVSHTRLDHLFEAYGQVFIQKVKNKHTLARIYFSRIPGMSEQLRIKLSGSHTMQGPSEIRGQRALKTS